MSRRILRVPRHDCASHQIGLGLKDLQILWGGHPEAGRYDGLFFSEVARQMGCSVVEAYLRISELSMGKTLCLLHQHNGDPEDETVLQKVLRHPANLFAADTILTSRGQRNPASFGTFPRIIQRYHKERALFTLEEAIAKMTGQTARRFGIRDRGIIAKNYRADLTIFDYNEIRDNTTVRDLEKRPSGIKNVFINGMEVVKDGAAIPNRLAGVALRA